MGVSAERSEIGQIKHDSVLISTMYDRVRIKKIVDYLKDKDSYYSQKHIRLIIFLIKKYNFGILCNGSTRDFGSLSFGSNPDIPTIISTKSVPIFIVNF